MKKIVSITTILLLVCIFMVACASENVTIAGPENGFAYRDSELGYQVIINESNWTYEKDTEKNLTLFYSMKDEVESDNGVQLQVINDSYNDITVNKYWERLKSNFSIDKFTVNDRKVGEKYAAKEYNFTLLGEGSELYGEIVFWGTDNQLYCVMKIANADWNTEFTSVYEDILSSFEIL